MKLAEAISCNMIPHIFANLSHSFLVPEMH